MALIIQESIVSRSANYRLLLLLFLLITIVAIVSFFATGKAIAISIFLGGIAFVLPNAYFVTSVYKDSQQTSPKLIVRRFYKGEIGKLLLTGSFFIVCFKLVETLHIVVFFISYAIVLLMNLIGLLGLSSHEKKNIE